MPAKFRTLETWKTLSAVVSARLREPYTIYAVVDNIGDEEGTVVVRLLDGFKTQVLDSKTLTIPAGGSVRVEFTRVAPDTLVSFYDTYYLSYLNMGIGQVDWERLVTVNYMPWDVRITCDIPDEVQLDSCITLTAKVEYSNGVDWYPYYGAVCEFVKHGYPATDPRSQFIGVTVNESGYASARFCFPSSLYAPGDEEYIAVSCRTRIEKTIYKYVRIVAPPTPPPPPPTPPPAPPPAPRVKLTVKIYGNGSTDPPAGVYEYDRGASVTLTAYPAPGNAFGYWVINGVPNSRNPVTIELYTDTAVEAHFLEQAPPAPPTPPVPPPAVKVKLTIIAHEGGSTSPAPGTYEYDAGSAVSITAIPSTGYVFDHWLVNGAVRAENPVAITLSTDTVVEAYFAVAPTPAPPTPPMPPPTPPPIPPPAPPPPTPPPTAPPPPVEKPKASPSTIGMTVLALTPVAFIGGVMALSEAKKKKA